MRFSPLGEFREGARVRLAYGERLAAGVQELGGVLSDRFEHREARLAVDGVAPLQEALVDQRS
jgi:hypothetical protein